MWDNLNRQVDLVDMLVALLISVGLMFSAFVIITGV